MCGLNYITRIFALLGEILVRIRVDKRSPPQGQYATARLEEVQSLHSRIMSTLHHVPEPFRLKKTHTQSHLPPDYGGAGFRQATFAEVKDFFDNPNASRANALNPFLVMQANLYVTQVSSNPVLFISSARSAVLSIWRRMGWAVSHCDYLCSASNWFVS